MRNCGWRFWIQTSRTWESNKRSQWYLMTSFETGNAQCTKANAMKRLSILSLHVLYTMYKYYSGIQYNTVLWKHANTPLTRCSWYFCLAFFHIATMMRLVYSRAFLSLQCTGPGVPLLPSQMHHGVLMKAHDMPAEILDLSKLIEDFFTMQVLQDHYYGLPTLNESQVLLSSWNRNYSDDKLSVQDIVARLQSRPPVCIDDSVSEEMRIAMTYASSEISLLWCRMCTDVLGLLESARHGRSLQVYARVMTAYEQVREAMEQKLMRFLGKRLVHIGTAKSDWWENKFGHGAIFGRCDSHDSLLARGCAILS